LEKWYQNVNADAKIAYFLALSEKVLDKLTDYDWYPTVRESIDLCWEWVEEKKHEGYDLYITIDDEDEGLFVISCEEDPFTGDRQAEFVYWCVFHAASYTIKQAYVFERKKHKVPQPIEGVNDEYTNSGFMEKIREVDGYREEWAERLKKYLLENVPAGSDKKIKRSELLSQI
jgi:hypothetical protein